MTAPANRTSLRPYQPWVACAREGVAKEKIQSFFTTVVTENELSFAQQLEGVMVRTSHG